MPTDRLARQAVAAAVALVPLLLGCGHGSGSGGAARDQVVAAHLPWSLAAPTWGARSRIRSDRIGECSGMVRGRRRPDLYWVHNDSGDSARIFAIDGAGDLVGEVQVTGARNVDWEAIAADPAGHLYICDTGNNDNDRRDLAVYVIDEPDPGAASAPVLGRLPFRYPDQTDFPDPAMNHDCEAAFWRDGHLYLLTKHRSDTRTRLYRMDDLAARAEQTLVLVDSLEVGSMVTAARLSPDGRQLAILSYEYLLLLDLPAASEPLLCSAPCRRLLIEARQCEALEFDGGLLRIANEQGEVHVLERSAVLAAGEPLPAGGGDMPGAASAAAPDDTPGATPAETPATAARAAMPRGYCPPRPVATLQAGATTPLALRRASGERREPAPPPAPRARASARIDGDVLRLELSWVTPAPAGDAPQTILVVAWGEEPSPRTRPGPGDRVWAVTEGAAGFASRRLAAGAAAQSQPAAAGAVPAPAPPRLGLERDGQRVRGTLVLPEAPAALNLVLFSPAGDDWYWGGDRSMLGPLNPFLWGALLRAPEPGGPPIAP